MSHDGKVALSIALIEADDIVVVEDAVGFVVAVCADAETAKAAITNAETTTSSRANVAVFLSIFPPPFCSKHQEPKRLLDNFPRLTPTNYTIYSKFVQNLLPRSNDYVCVYSACRQLVFENK